MIHEKSISYLAALTVPWPAVIGCWSDLKTAPRVCNQVPFCQSQSTNGREPRERSKVSCLGCPQSSNLFTSSVCVCVFEGKREVWHDDNTHHALCTHTRTHSQRCIFPFQIELHRADWIFLPCIKDKNTPLSVSTPQTFGSIHPIMPAYLFSPSSQVFFICTSFSLKFCLFMHVFFCLSLSFLPLVCKVA